MQNVNLTYGMKIAFHDIIQSRRRIIEQPNLLSTQSTPQSTPQSTQQSTQQSTAAQQSTTQQSAHQSTTHQSTETKVHNLKPRKPVQILEQMNKKIISKQHVDEAIIVKFDRCCCNQSKKYLNNIRQIWATYATSPINDNFTKWLDLYETLCIYESHIYCLYSASNGLSIYIGHYIGGFNNVKQAFIDSGVLLKHPHFECLGYFSSFHINYAIFYHIVHNFSEYTLNTKITDPNRHDTMHQDGYVNLNKNQIYKYKYLLGCMLLHNRKVESCDGCGMDVFPNAAFTHMLNQYTAILMYNNVNDTLINITRGKWYKNIIEMIYKQNNYEHELSDAIYNYHMGNKKQINMQTYVKPESEPKTRLMKGKKQYLYIPVETRYDYDNLQQYVDQYYNANDQDLYTYDYNWQDDL